MQGKAEAFIIPSRCVTVLFLLAAANNLVQTFYYPTQQAFTPYPSWPDPITFTIIIIPIPAFDITDEKLSKEGLLLIIFIYAFKATLFLARFCRNSELHLLFLVGISAFIAADLGSLSGTANLLTWY